MPRTTPPRPVDVAAVLPKLAPMARTATRLHPRAGSPPEEKAALDRIKAGRPWPEDPVPMLPVAQLSTRDIPRMRAPEGADLLQVLWCPFGHGAEPYPKTALYWRAAANVTDILTEAPEPAAAEDEQYVPEPCLLNPEQVTEYPNFLELSEDQQEQISQCCRQQSTGTDMDNPFEPPPEDLYHNELSTAPGWKVGDWAKWALNDPFPQFCPACDTEMVPLLTIASVEWYVSAGSWIPYEDQDHAAPGAYPDLSQSTMIRISDNDHLQLYTCPASPDHPHTALVQ